MKSIAAKPSFSQPSLCKQRFSKTLIAAAVFALAAPSLSQAATFTESDGLVFFEAEAGEPFGGWTVDTAYAHYSGDAYIEWTGSNYFDTSQAGRDTLRYEIEITSPGNYEFRWRTRIAKGDSNTESNDSWVRFPTGVNVAGEQAMNGWTKVYMGHFGAWFWDAKMVDSVGANVRQYFSAGTHVVEVAGRSYGHAIDKMALFKYEELSLSPNDLDSRTGTPQSSVDGNQAAIDAEAAGEENTAPSTNNEVTIIANGVAYAPGECAAGRLVLVPSADAHLLNTQVFNQPALSIAPEPMQAIMRFDLTAVSGITSAALEVHQLQGSGDATVDFQLLQSSDWTEADGQLANAPINVLQLQTATLNWAADTRYSVTLPAASLPSEMLELGIDGNNAEQVLTLASREDSLNMPLLVLSGGGDFCQNYTAALASQGGESTETGSDTGTGTGSGTSSGSGSGAESGEGGNTGSETGSTADNGTGSETGSETGNEVGGLPDSGTGTDTGTEAETGAETNGAGGSDIGSESEEGAATDATASSSGGGAWSLLSLFGLFVLSFLRAKRIAGRQGQQYTN